MNVTGCAEQGKMEISYIFYFMRVLVENCSYILDKELASVIEEFKSIQKIIDNLQKTIDLRK